MEEILHHLLSNETLWKIGSSPYQLVLDSFHQGSFFQFLPLIDGKKSSQPIYPWTKIQETPWFDTGLSEKKDKVSALNPLFYPNQKNNRPKICCCAAQETHAIVRVHDQMHGKEPHLKELPAKFRQISMHCCQPCWKHNMHTYTHKQVHICEKIGTKLQLYV